MLTHTEVIINKDYEAIHSSVSGCSNSTYACTDYMHHPTGTVVTVVEMQLNEVGKDELDALYRVQRIIEDKIHKVRNRPLQNEVVSVNHNKYALAACDDDLLYPGTEDTFA